MIQERRDHVFVEIRFHDLGILVNLGEFRFGRAKRR